MSEYEAFGIEWQAHVKKLPKNELVTMLAKALREKQKTQVKLYRAQQAAADARRAAVEDVLSYFEKWESLVQDDFYTQRESGAKEAVADARLYFSQPKPTASEYITTPADPIGGAMDEAG